ncbi:hypothetical protein F8M41_008847 [Gigaspora margarita]|uniref:Uncharacterized protein n=1 Tax=Gigaspora margarita TaxID=4874 RepID=A0A8H4AVF2_GIGMA|nr:hypothetical protein F8M41_008847 [Gigaspora margarita]
MVDSFTHIQPKEVSINGYNMINAKFIALKDPVLNYFTSNFSDKDREKFWHKITMVFSYILQPISDLIRIASQQANTLLQSNDPSGKNIQVPVALIDSEANCSLKSKGLAKLLGMNIDKNKKPSIK